MTICPTKVINGNYNTQLNSVVRLDAVNKIYPLMKQSGLLALEEISLEVCKGEILGIIGRNGAGKTTLLNIITGTLSPTKGQASVNGKVLGLFNLGVGFQDELTGRENIFLNGAIIGATKEELKEKINSIIGFSELGNFIDMPLGTYSQGMRLRLAFSIIISLDFDILAIDEVLAVGDALFQSKCFERLMDFRRVGKTLIITSQGMELIERFCDKVALLDHGKLLFHGNTVEGINKYRALLNTEKFFVGKLPENQPLIENTKKWAEDNSGWGQELGTKEVIIKGVEFINRFGFSRKKVKSGERLKVKVYFTVRNKVKEPHFGVAIFRNDGVYCYGPNTQFDGHKISELKEGNGYFVLDFSKLLLAAGEYRISVAIWDKNETIPFHYHEGYYPLIVYGDNFDSSLLNIPVIPRKQRNLNIKVPIGLQDNIDNQLIEPRSVKLLSPLEEEKKVFFTNEPIKIRVSFINLTTPNDKCFLWIGLFRDDNMYCQGFNIPVNGKLSFELLFPKLPLLPGSHKIVFGVWDNKNRKFLMYSQYAYRFNMVFNRQDHGTVYLKHSWSWRGITEYKNC